MFWLLVLGGCCAQDDNLLSSGTIEGPIPSQETFNEAAKTEISDENAVGSDKINDNSDSITQTPADISMEKLKDLEGANGIDNSEDATKSEETYDTAEIDDESTEAADREKRYAEDEDDEYDDDDEIEEEEEDLDDEDDDEDDDEYDEEDDDEDDDEYDDEDDYEDDYEDDDDNSSYRKKRDLTNLLDLVDDYCEEEEGCVDDILEDLIYYIEGEAFDSDALAGTSRASALLDSIDNKCEGDIGCEEKLLGELRSRAFDDDIVDDRS